MLLLGEPDLELKLALFCTGLAVAGILVIAQSWQLQSTLHLLGRKRSGSLVQTVLLGCEKLPLPMFGVHLAGSGCPAGNSH